MSQLNLGDKVKVIGYSSTLEPPHYQKEGIVVLHDGGHVNFMNSYNVLINSKCYVVQRKHLVKLNEAGERVY